MKIDYITAISPYNNTPKTAFTTKAEIKQSSKEYSYDLLYNQFNDQLAFEARVDKGLQRFYEYNKTRMPITVKEYIEGLNNFNISPLTAQRDAFQKLSEAKTVFDIKQFFPKECMGLFKNLIPANQTMAKRGILQSIKENEELLALSNQGILKDKSDLTVYLVKKIFLEGKTIDEINQDLETDLDEDFKADFKFKNTDSKYIYSTTLKALGIALPAFEYLQSLKYTREGYSDSVGDNISKSLQEYINSLSDEERISRAKQSVKRYENWWSSLTRKQIIEMIADQTSTLEMLKAFKKSEREEKKLNQQTNQQTKELDQNSSNHKTKIRVGSKKLAENELFIKWATNNLKIFEASMTEAEKDTLHIKRMQRLTERWATMTPEERTDYISKMKSGSEPLRYTMIDAWNNSTDLIKDLSKYLRENQIYKPADMLFSNVAFSEFQSKIMTEFWNKHPEYSKLLGENIIKSQEKVNRAISNGTFEDLKKEIIRNKTQRIKELEASKQKETELIKINGEIPYPQYIQEFQDAYFNGPLKPRLKHLPKSYLKDFINMVANEIPEEQVIAWTKNLRREQLNIEDQINLKKLSSTEPLNCAIYNRSIEAAIAATLFECTQNPDVYTISHSDVKTALYKLDIGENPIELGSLKLNQDFIIPVIKRHIDDNKIERLYNNYKTELSEVELEQIIDYYFTQNIENPTYEGFDYTGLKDYLKTYGKTLLILFSSKSIYPSNVKKALYQKIKNNAPYSLLNSFKFCVYDNPNMFEIEPAIKKSTYLYTSKYPFLPTYYAAAYQEELMKAFRKTVTNADDLEEFNKYCTVKRKDANERGKLAIIPKIALTTENKLKILVIEQALADILYESTGNKEVYSMEIEELCDNIEVFNLVKRFPSQERSYYSQSLGKDLTIKANKKLNLGKISRLAEEYHQEIKDWLHEYSSEGKELRFEDLVYILNPDETKPELDENVALRIQKYGLNLVK